MSEEKKDKPNLEAQFKQAFNYLGPQLITQIFAGTDAAKRTQSIMQDQLLTKVEKRTRKEYPEGRTGYLEWRREQGRRHGERLAGMMADAGYTPQDQARVGVLLRKEGIKRDAEVQALIDQAGSLLTVPQVIGVVNELGLDYSQIDSLVSVDPDAVRESAESGAIRLFALGASFLPDIDVPDVGDTLDRLAGAMERNIGDVTLAGADAAVGSGSIHMMIETVGGTHTLNGVEDQVFLSLEHEPDNNVYTDGLSARDFLSIGQNLVAMHDVGGDAEVGFASDAFVRMAFNLDGLVSKKSQHYF